MAIISLKNIISNTIPSKYLLYVSSGCIHFTLVKPLDIRINGQQNYVKRQLEKSKICEQAWEHGQRVQFQYTTILQKESNNRRKIKDPLILLNENDRIATHQSSFLILC